VLIPTLIDLGSGWQIDLGL